MPHESEADEKAASVRSSGGTAPTTLYIAHSEPVGPLCVLRADMLESDLYE